MKESVLHFVWQYKLFPAEGLRSAGGELIKVIDTGFPNRNAGPDFFNAKIQIGDTVWAGNVEIHTASSEWCKHNHHKDKAYDSVVLHVVADVDAEVSRADGQLIPQLLLPVPEAFLACYNELMEQKKWIACADKIASVAPVYIQSWKNALLTERLGQRTGAIKALLEDSNSHWEEAFYIILARSFGFSVNSDPFEQLARSLPLAVLAKHRDNLLQLEALLYGQAGLLPEKSIDEYTAGLIKEYKFLSLKYGLKKVVNASQWKLLRLRPSNFPYIRIAQFADLIHSSSKLFSKILETESIAEMRDFFNCKASAYWDVHYSFSGEPGRKRVKAIGRQAVDTILINTVIPFVFSYGFARDNEDLQDRALHLLEGIEAEHNHIIEGWNALGLGCKSAYDSQALLQLKKHYCDKKDCLRCRIGHKVLTM